MTAVVLYPVLNLLEWWYPPHPLPNLLELIFFQSTEEQEASQAENPEWDNP